MMSRLEHCYFCDTPTGRAGAGEDSIFWLDGEIGPMCEECSHKLAAEVAEDSGVDSDLAEAVEAVKLLLPLAEAGWRESNIIPSADERREYIDARKKAKAVIAKAEKGNVT